MASYAKINVGNEGRVELHDKLALTGAEVSLNRLPAGAGVPFVHFHRNNEEIYGVLEGAGRAVIDGEEIALTPKEYDILYYLMQHPGKVFTPAELYSAVWNEAPVAIDNTVAVHIRHLREKLEINPSEPRYLKVVWGKGYKLEGDRT